MQPLNLPPFETKLRQGKKGYEIFDEIRRKFVRLTPEEWVRQHFINLFVNHLGYPRTLIVVEGELRYHQLKKRFDILAYDPSGNPRLIVECKAPEIPVNQKVFDQIAMYNVTLQVDYLVVTNGLVHYSCRIDHVAGKFRFLDFIPDYTIVSGSNTR